jgi:unconventional prefoldin RPB5 interactor 1
MERPLGFVSEQPGEEERARLVQEYSAMHEDIVRLKQKHARYDDIEEQLEQLPRKLHHDVMIPFGKLAFVPGRIIHTNEIVVALSDGHMAEMSAHDALSICQRRRDKVEETIQLNQLAMESLNKHMQKDVDDSEYPVPEEGFVEIREEYDPTAAEARNVRAKPGNWDQEPSSPACGPPPLEEVGGVDEASEFGELLARLAVLEAEESAEAAGTSLAPSQKRMAFPGIIREVEGANTLSKKNDGHGHSHSHSGSGSGDSGSNADEKKNPSTGGRVSLFKQRRGQQH